MEWYKWASQIIFDPLMTGALDMFSPSRYEAWIDDAKELVSSWLGW